MPAGTLTSVEEYLNSSYHPDREFIDGSILERCFRYTIEERLLNDLLPARWKVPQHLLRSFPW